MRLTARRGASLLEITACILAVAVGVWLGAQYLGLDLHSAAYTALSEADMIDQMPEDWRMAPPESQEPLSDEQQALALSAELEELRREVASLNDNAAAATAKFAEQSGQLSPEQLKLRKQTLGFWSRLKGVRDEVVRLQMTADDAINEQNVYKVLEVRRRAYAYGSKAVKAAMTEGVDPEALQFAELMIAWFDDGDELYDEAMKLWQGEHPPVGGLASDQSLEQAQQHHENQSRLLFQKSERLRDMLVERYHVAFPNIAAPAGGQN